MNTVSKPELLFYQKLGELFYAIAASDNMVSKAGYKALTQLVEEEWKCMDDNKEQAETDAAYQISIVFEWFDYERMDAEDCFESFINYYHEHQKLFSKKRKQLILKTAHTIANAFNGNNKSELILLTKLQFLFKNN